jgi:hypothetical protein
MSRLGAPKMSHSVDRQRAVGRSAAWWLFRLGETWLPSGYRAELASVFIGGTLGPPCDIPNHASYIASWAAKLKEDKREIFRAAANAQRIADYLLAFHPDFAATTTDEAESATPVAALAA